MPPLPDQIQQRPGHPLAMLIAWQTINAVRRVLALFTVGDVYASLCKKKRLRSIYRAAKVTSAILAVI